MSGSPGVHLLPPGDLGLQDALERLEALALIRAFSGALAWVNNVKSTRRRCH
jgi:hypothetical protein